MNKRQLKEIIKQDKKIYSSKSYLKKIYDIITKRNNRNILKNIIYARKYRFYCDNRISIIDNLKFLYYSRKNNILGRKNNLELYGKFGKEIRIYHPGIIINKNAIIGDNVKLHGFNCIGNKGENKNAPKIGNNVDIGIGAVIIGNIKIADNITIGANATVTKSFLEEGITIAGTPAKKI